MRRDRSLPPCARRLSRTAALLGLSIAIGGCQQPPTYFSFGTGPSCVPVVPAPPASVNSNVGDPPTQVIEGGTTSVEVPNRTTIVGGESTGRVVVSEPMSRGRNAWRSLNDPDAEIATSVEGASSPVSSSTVVR
jgi:hypothetical protein